MKDKNTLEWLQHYEEAYQKNADLYQQTGQVRYDNAAYKYQAIADAFRAKLAQESEIDHTLKKRTNNRRAVELVKDTYTKAEVSDMLDKAVWW